MKYQKISLLFSDALAFAVSFALGLYALVIYSQYFEQESFLLWWNTTGSAHAWVHVFFCVLVMSRFHVRGLYVRRFPFWDELRMILGSIAYIAMSMGVVVLVAKWPFSRVVWIFSWILAALFVPLFRNGTRVLLMKMNVWEVPITVIGSGETAYQVWKAFRSERGLGFQIQKYFRLNDLEGARFLPPEFPVLETNSVAIIEQVSEPEFVVVALEPHERAAGQALMENLSLKKSEVHIVPPIGGLTLFGLESNHFFSHEILLLRSKNNLTRWHMALMKRVFDVLVSGSLLILLSPLLVYLAARIRMSGPGVFFSHRRIGRNGEMFSCYKFRSMVPNAEAILKDLLARDPEARREWEEKTKITNDPRITRVGEFLRKTSLDELPQLWNVFRGDMSLVGPRPIITAEVEKYGPRFKFYKMVRPGLTGLWQVSGRSDTDFQYRVHLDTWYVKNWSLWYDIAILFKTVDVVLNRRGAY